MKNASASHRASRDLDTRTFRDSNARRSDAAPRGFYRAVLLFYNFALISRVQLFGGSVDSRSSGRYNSSADARCTQEKKRERKRDG